MDFDLTEEQSAAVEVAQKLLADKSTPDLLRALEHASTPDGDQRFDRDLWSQMADAGLLSLAIPESAGGAGLGILEACLVLQEVGRRTAAVPALSTMIGALVLGAHGDDGQQELLPGVAAGEVVLGIAISEDLRDATDPGVVATLASGDDRGVTLFGTKTNVWAGVVADHLLVTAALDETPAVFLVDVSAAGVTVTRQDTTSGVPEARISFDGAPATRVGGDDAARFLVEHATVGVCAVMAGVCEEAIKMTGEYATTREQFGRAIATFQAVGQRAADSYVDTQSIVLTMLQAAWRLGAGYPAAREVAVAKYFASQGGHRALHAAQHIHGGIGVDRDYPLHRYFLLGKQLDLALGGASRQLLRLGRLLAADER